MAAKAAWIGAVRGVSCTLAGVVSAWTTKRGAPASQVSVKWTMEPVQVVPALARNRASVL